MDCRGRKLPNGSSPYGEERNFLDYLYMFYWYTVSMDEKFMREAISLAQAAKAAGELPFGAVVVKDGQIISQGQCTIKSMSDVTMHAELSAISKACRLNGTTNLGDCTLYATCEPCVMCSSAIAQAGIQRVVIGSTRDDLPDIFHKRNIRVEQIFSDSELQVKIVSGVLRKEAIQLFNKDVK